MSREPEPCDGWYVSGHRVGDPCPYKATTIIDLRRERPIRVCGYHARAYTANVRYPMGWSQEVIWRVLRRMQERAA